MEGNRSLNVALVGYGYWGPKLVRNIRDCTYFHLKYLIDQDEKLLRDFNLSNPDITILTNIQAALEDKSIDAIIIATPPKMHYELSKQSLLAGKHILVEKPFTTSFEEASEIVALAERVSKKVMVDYTFLYNGTIQSIKEQIDKKTFGQILYVDSVRINLGIFQNDVNVVWDLACHDLSIFNYLLEELPHSVQAMGIDALGNGIENIAYIHLKYSELFAHINCSWSSPVKIRRMLLGGSKSAILYNDIEPTDKIKVYDKGVVYQNPHQRESLLQDYRMGEVYIPKYDTTEPLQNVVNTFYNAIVYGEKSKSDGEDALLVMFMLEMIQKSIDLGGKEVKIEWEQVGQSLYSYIMSKGMLKEPSKALRK
jgi:predicted dehydrogenase